MIVTQLERIRSPAAAVKNHLGNDKQTHPTTSPNPDQVPNLGNHKQIATNPNQNLKSKKETLVYIYAHTQKRTMKNHILFFLHNLTKPETRTHPAKICTQPNQPTNNHNKIQE